MTQPEEEAVDMPFEEVLWSLEKAMLDCEDLVCWECVSDPVLRRWLREIGRVGRCSFCRKRRITVPLPQFAQKIDEAIRKYYCPAEYSDNPQYWADGRTAAEIIEDIAGVEQTVAGTVDKYLHHAESHDVQDGGDAYYRGVPLEHVPPYPGDFMETWEYFEERLKHRVRFFDDEAKRSLDEVFADVRTLADGKAIVTLEPTGEYSTFYRARILDHGTDAKGIVRDPARELGPPPPSRAAAGRMNPVGIPVFYGAFAEDVAVAEVRPPVGAVVAIGKFILLRTIQLLDVSFLPFMYHE